MMTTRTKKTGRTQVTTRTTTMTALEEKVLRMRHGLTAPLNMALEQVGQDNPAVAAQLKAIEERAMAAVSARATPAKRKIVSALRRKSER